MNKLFFVSNLILLYTCCWAQQRVPAFEINERLGRGINMGNAFEAPSETEWGNPWNPEYFDIIADLGFQHVRLPVRWEPSNRSMATEPYTINNAFLKRIKEVVDEALKNKLHIIVNMHHHEALYENPDAQKERFLSQWSQIATFFQDYPDSLLFEVMNEPHGNLTPDKWNIFFKDALAEIRKTNPQRAVLLGIAEYGGLSGIVHLQIPEDEHIILSPHYYNPFTFTHQGAEWVGGNADEWLGTKWLDTEIDRQTVESEFSFAIQYSEENNIPIHVGEFGAYGKADLDSRVRWTTFLARWFEEQGFSWAYWEFSAGFGIYNPDTREILQPLADALLINEMPEPIPVIITPVYTSNFTSGADGWTLNTQGGAAGSLSTSSGNLVASLTEGGSEAWHVQLIKSPISIESGKTYRVSFKAKSSEQRGSSSYVGKASDPWTAYSGYIGITLDDLVGDYSYSFTMGKNSDSQARLVFDLGKSSAGITIYEIKVEEISLDMPATGFIDEIRKQNIKAYPNPVFSALHVPNLQKYNHVQLVDIKGQSAGLMRIEALANTINMEMLPAGVYLLRLFGNGLVDQLKIVKE